MSESSCVAIVGGGLAGLAAAVGLAENGLPVTLLESRPRLGGRASSIVDRTTGETIDNCQHVTMGCCTNFAHFCRTTGLDRFVRTEPVLYFVGPDGRTHEFAANGWPAPLHLAKAFRNLGYLTFRDRLAIARGLRSLALKRRTATDSRSFAEWLRDHRQTPAAVEFFWHVVLVSALSESLDRIDVGHARKVFVDGFLANRQGWQVQIPTVPLDVLYGAELIEWLQRRGVTVRLQTGVERVVSEHDRIVTVELRSGERIAADDCILAVPHSVAPSLLPPGLIDHPTLSRMQQLETSPIASVHLWFDRPITELPHAVFVGRLCQWVFRRSPPLAGRGPAADGEGQHPPSNALQADPAAVPSIAAQWCAVDPSQPSTRTPAPSAAPNASYYQAVISASRSLDGVPAEGIVARVVDELCEVWPAAQKARLIHGRVITERRAVFAPVPGVDRLRPPQQTPIANLQLAGDWTRTGWPATMEGAVRSGFLAAENVLRRRGRPVRLRRPDLPADTLPQWLFGLK